LRASHPASATERVRSNAERTVPHTVSDSQLLAPSQPVPARQPPLPTSPSHHGHLWTLLDGTPAHSPPGILTRDHEGNLACHLCGRWFVHLGAHLRAHRWTAAQYRAAVGLPLHTPLCRTDLSTTIGARQQQHWRRSPDLRAQFEAGQQMARTGELGRRAAAATRARDASGQTPSAVLSARAEQLTRGRLTQQSGRQQRLAEAIAATGAATLHELLVASYANGDSLEALARVTGFSRHRLRSEMTAASILVRPTGHNLPESKTRRAAIFDARTAERVGTTDIRRWLLSQQRQGKTMQTMAHLTGRSIPWVRSRLHRAL
jgi:hypothetical protein